MACRSLYILFLCRALDDLLNSWLVLHNKAAPEGFEPPFSRSVVECFIHLSHGAVVGAGTTSVFERILEIAPAVQGQNLQLGGERSRSCPRMFTGLRRTRTHNTRKSIGVVKHTIIVI